MKNLVAPILVSVLVGCGSDTDPPGGAPAGGSAADGAGGESGGGALGGEAAGGAGGGAGGGAAGGAGGGSGCADNDPLRQPLFGDLHVHTSYSMDAWLFQAAARHDPNDAYAFAKGAPLELATFDGTAATVQLKRPLDFAAATDHSEFLGETEICTTQGLPGYDSALCTYYRDDTKNALLRFAAIASAVTDTHPNFCGTEGEGCIEVAKTVWQRVIEAANEALDPAPSCGFTSFVAYEWTGGSDGPNAHRNVIFRNDAVPDRPLDYFDYPSPEALHQGLIAECIEQPSGCDVLAIPHNSNLSNGTSFLVSDDITPDQAAVRAALEPLAEIVQHKGASECQYGISDDPFCDFETLEVSCVVAPEDPSCLPTCAEGESGAGCLEPLSFARGGLTRGLELEESVGTNPLAFGFIGSTDTHASTMGATDEAAWRGHVPVLELDAQDRVTGDIGFSPGGLAVVWAEENSRDSIFAALRRRETYATSGTRPTVRFFGGWSLPGDMCSAPEFAAVGYEQGVPMGGEMSNPPSADAKPSFAIYAAKDVGTADAPGTALQRAQLVKGWVDAGVYKEAVIDIAGGDNGASVDEATCATSGPGQDQLCGVYVDQSYQPGERAFYYARVIENPSCRWTAYACNGFAAGEAPSESQTVRKVIQERALTSPIWVHP